MKVRILQRVEEAELPRAGQLQQWRRNPDPRLHPFQREREYMRALTAAKLQKMFGKPFVCALEGHTDSVKAIARSWTQPSTLFSSSCNGEVCVWSLASRKCLAKIPKAHDGFARDNFLISGGDDCKIKVWSLGALGGGPLAAPRALSALDAEALERSEKMSGVLSELYGQGSEGSGAGLVVKQTPVATFTSDGPVASLDHCAKKNVFVSCGGVVCLWNYGRSSPTQTFEWGSEHSYCVRFSPADPSLFAAGLGSNSLALYDTRGNTPIRRVHMKMKTNAISWNPMEPVCLAAANEDQCIYTFDIRNLSQALRVHKDFVNAVLDVDFSPTGLEFAGASFDGTLRIFNAQDGRSREVYHTKRMQSVLSCRYSLDGRFVMSGSADMCLRVWKAKAAAPLGPQVYRERAALAYREKLLEKYERLPEIKRILRHRHVPRLIKKTQEKKRIMQDAAKRREENRIAHTTPGKIQRVPARKKAIYKEIA